MAQIWISLSRCKNGCSSREASANSQHTLQTRSHSVTLMKPPDPLISRSPLCFPVVFDLAYKGEKGEEKERKVETGDNLAPIQLDSIRHVPAGRHECTVCVYTYRSRVSRSSPPAIFCFVLFLPGMRVKPQFSSKLKRKIPVCCPAGWEIDHWELWR